MTLKQMTNVFWAALIVIAMVGVEGIAYGVALSNGYTRAIEVFPLLITVTGGVAILLILFVCYIMYYDYKQRLEAEHNFKTSHKE